MKLVASCFDLDMTNYLHGGDPWDELEAVWPVFMDICERLPDWKTTWFVRIDAHMATWFGEADYVFVRHADKMEWLRKNGHAVGWHFHSFAAVGGKWVQNTDEYKVINEMKQMSVLVQKHSLDMLRMGWAYHTNGTLKTAVEMGIKLDCSAFPRPVYTWDNPNRNWSRTGQDPYYPAMNDYQSEGVSGYQTLEMPISTSAIHAEGDTEAQVMRYINPVYHQEVFKQGIQNYQGNTLNLVAHPYEFLPDNTAHKLMAFDPQVMLKNLHWLKTQEYEYVTITDLAEAWKAKMDMKKTIA